MQFAAYLATHLVDPRGRSGRRDFLAVAVTMFVLQLVCFALVWNLRADVDGWTVIPANLAFCWMGYAAISRRLHDLGRSAWWMPVAAGTWIAGGFVLALVIAVVVGPHAVKPGTAGFWATCLFLLLPPLGLALWLHMAAGEPDANRWGPPTADNPAYA